MWIHLGWQRQPISAASSLSYPFPDAGAGALSPPGREDGLPGRLPGMETLISRPRGTLVETGSARLPTPSGISGAPGPLQASNQGVGGRGRSLWNPMMPGSSIPVILGSWFAGSHRTLQTIVVDPFECLVDG